MCPKVHDSGNCCEHWAKGWVLRATKANDFPSNAVFFVGEFEAHISSGVEGVEVTGNMVESY
jgi:hypothetical protein